MLVIAANFSSTFFIGALLGALVLLAGLVLGIMLTTIVHRRSPRNETNAQQTQQSLAVMNALAAFTQGFKGDLSRHHEMISGLADQLEHSGDDPHPGDAGSVLVKQITEANRALKERLDAAESTLELQASELESYMSKAHTDTLTTLPNRRAFDDEMQQRLSAWNRYGTPVSLVLMDIDHFKSFNDTHGHLAGDFVLAQVAKVLRNHIRGSDIVARYGGEEFAAVLPETGLEDAGVVGVSLLNAVRNAAFEYQGKNFTVTLSAGVASARKGDKPGDMVERADKALYESKRHGRDQGFSFDSDVFLPLADSGRSERVVTLGQARIEDQPSTANEVKAKPRPSILEVCDELRQRFLEVTQQ